MKSKISFFSLPMFGNTLRRFTPFTVLYSVLILLAGPVTTAFILTINALMKSEDNTANILQTLFGNYTRFGDIRASQSTFAMILAILLFSYLHKKRALDLFHSIPLRRENILLTYSASGALILGVPMLISALGNLLVLVVFQKIALVKPLIYLANCSIEILLTLCIFMMVIFVATISGTIVNNILLTLYLFSVSFALVAITAGFFTAQLFGFYISDWIKNAYRFTPLIRAAVTSILPFGWLDIVFFAVLTVGLLFLALFFYKKRKSEVAGKGFAFPFVSSVLHWTVAYFGTLCGYLISLTTKSIGWEIFWYIIGGTILWVIANVIFNRGFKKLLPTWKQFLAFQLAVGLFFLCVKFDVTGFQKRVPNESDISQASFGYTWFLEGYKQNNFNGKDYLGGNPLSYLVGYNDEGFIYKDPQNIHLITELHKKIIEDNKNRLKFPFSTLELDQSNEPTASILLDYKLKSLFSLKRSYTYNEEEVKKLLIPLFNSMEYKKQAFDIFTQSTVYNKAILDYPKGSVKFSSLGTKSKETITGLIEALKKDITDLDFKTLLNNPQPLFYLKLTEEDQNAQQTNKPFVPYSYNEISLPVYPTFSNVLKYVDEKDINTNKLKSVTDIVSIDIVNDYNKNYGTTFESFQITDPKLFNEIYWSIVRENDTYNKFIDAEINYKDGHYSKVILDLDKAPKWLINKISTENTVDS